MNGMDKQQVNISQKNIAKVIIPVPPIEEQCRIVNRVGQLMAQIDEYEKMELELTSLKEAFPGDMRTAILQAAMQGKLTEQLGTDGSVEELLLSATTERISLIGNKEIKNEKLQNIADADCPFEIPETWRFVRMGQVIRLQSGQDLTPDMYSDDIQEGIPYLTGASNIDNGTVIINRWTTHPKAIAVKNDLLLTCKGTVGHIVAAVR